ncbi:MAG: magnesium transporter [Erysipelotrichaceae bacterium]|nr:magnesium transporter [Erysipelotrichaceae bacterium]
MEYTEITKELLAELVFEHQVEQIREIFDEHNIVNLAEIVADMELAEALFIFKTLRKDMSGSLFTYLVPEKQEKLITLLTGTEIKQMLDELYSDDIMEFIDEMPEEIVKKILKSASKSQREEINQLLSYKENSCGSIMSTDYVELSGELTIEQAMEETRKQREVAESISYGYVLKNQILVGTISLRDIIFAPDDHLVEDEMETDIVYVTTNDDQEEAGDLMSRYDLTMIPVVDAERKLVGIITADDVIDVIEEEATEDIHKMAAVNPLEGSYLEATPYAVAKSRLPWLMVLMISAAISEYIITRNNTLIMLIPALSYFYPTLMDTAGNAGSQAAAMVIRGIVTDDLGLKDIAKVVSKEVRVAVLCGIVMFTVNLLRILLTMRNVGLGVALITSGTIFAIIVVAKLVGGLLPLLAAAIKLDPAVMASPLIATTCDAISLTLYFALASVFLGGM